MPRRRVTISRLECNADYIKYLGEREPISAQQSWRVLAMLAGHWQLRGYGFWLVELKQTAEFVGSD
ncbi:MAG: acetyltransferase [Osedax symbiont Rs2]|nr:MAG: acetyltransferase [Osedax symbiont Rs2]